MRVRTWSVLLMVGVAACGADDLVAPTSLEPSAAISDAAHGGTAGFYWLPPMLPASPAAGTFDPDISALNPTLLICPSTVTDCGTGTTPLVTFTIGSTPAIELAPLIPQYEAKWKPTGWSTGTYRIHLLAGAEGARRELGYADVQLTQTSQQAKQATSDGCMGLKIGSTLRISFRIETGIVGSVAVAPATATINTSQTAAFTATVRDLHGAALSGRTVAWSSTSTPASGVVASLTPTSGTTDAAGQLATTLTAGGTAGTATITATAEAVAGTAALTVRGEPLYVSEYGSNRVLIFAPDANGNVEPTAMIAGPNTGINGPAGLARDASDNLYVANYTAATIKVYAPGAIGDAAPIRSLTLAANPHGILFDDAGNLYVAYRHIGRVDAYAPGASGSATPIRTITGASTGLGTAWGLAVDAAGNLYVSDWAAHAIRVFAPGANGNVAPIRTIAGGNTGLSRPTGLVFDGAGNLYASQEGNNSIRVFAADANGDVAPIRTITGANTGLSVPTGLAFNSEGNLYVPNHLGVVSITVYAPGASGDATPVRTIAGTNTGLTQPGWVMF